MNEPPAVEIEQAHVRVNGCTPERAERVSRLIFNHLQGMLGRDCLRAGAPRVVPHLHVPSLEVDWDTMEDDVIARQGAIWIYRWLQTAG
jgi:hypothetical protein